MTYDADNWLVSATRELGTYVDTLLADPDAEVEMSFPNTRDWTKETPLPKTLIHFEQDDMEDRALGFGSPGVDVVNNLTGTVEHQEAAWHLINFDVGVWVSAEGGGATKRMETVQALKNMFTTAGGKTAFNEATEGLWVVSFDGGRNALDRINDIPVWRAMEMTLVLRVFSRHLPVAPDILIGDFVQDQDFVIT